jgi:YrbI family 3-deoxy-D-manno-octulosonate 8-phosphate phosphatase
MEKNIQNFKTQERTGEKIRMDKEKLEEFIIKASKIKLIAIGVDGVLTDAGMYFSPDGDIIRKFNRRDGMGIQILKTSGIKTAVISSVESTMVDCWCKMFHVDYIRLGCSNKFHEIEKLQIKLGIEMDDIAYIADDIDEIDILRKVGVGVTVQDGMSVNKRSSVYITKRKGGEGAVREVIEMIMIGKSMIK